MEDQPKPTIGPAPFAHLALRDTRRDEERRIADFNERQRRNGSKKRWHDYHPEDAANDDR